MFAPVAGGNTTLMLSNLTTWQRRPPCWQRG
jgi:hypothetical protein